MQANWPKVVTPSRAPLHCNIGGSHPSISDAPRASVQSQLSDSSFCETTPVMDALANPLIGVGVYTPTEAAHLTGVPATSISRWLRGYSFVRAAERRESPPVWRRAIADVDGHLTVTFLDMMEARFIHAFRRHHVSWPFIRAAARMACEMFGAQHPFTLGRFKTDGNRIFHQLESAGEVKLFDLNRRAWVFNDIVEPSLYTGVDLEDDQVARWYPLHPNRAIVIDPRVAFGRPVLAEEGVPVDVIAAAVAAQEGDIAAVSRWYKVPAKSVRAAVQFHRRSAARLAA